MRWNKEAGQTLFMAAASLFVLMGVLGLGIDMGMLRYDKRIQQTAADAAAVAGANNLAWEGSSTVICAGQNGSKADGFADTSGGGGCANGALSACATSSAAVGTVCVQISDPASGPTTGPHAGNPNYVEAYVSVVQPTYFMRIFGVTKATVTTRAVATDVSGGSNAINCMYTLGNPGNEIGVDPFGNTTLNATNCGIVDNGNFDPTGNALRINACSFQVSGIDTGNNAGNVLCNGNALAPSYASPTVQDPFANQLTAPAVGTPINNCCSGSSVSPGTYNGISIKSDITFQPGVYVVTGGNLACGAKNTITGTGVMFYFTNGSTLNCQGGDTLNLTAMNASQAQAAGYPKDAGILMYQDPNDTNTGIPTKGAKSPCPPPGAGTNTGPELSGNDGTTLNGVMYFPADQLYLNGTSGTTTVGPLVMYTACIGGNSTLNVQGTTGLPVTLPTLSNAILVE
jgi:hypothetical protein